MVLIKVGASRGGSQAVFAGAHSGSGGLVQLTDERTAELIAVGVEPEGSKR